MNNLWLLTKVNLLTLFDFSKLKNSNHSKEVKQSMRKSLLMIFAFLIIAYYVYIYVKEMMPVYVALNMPSVLLGQFFVVVSIFVLFTDIFRINGILFNYKDYDLLMSLPIKKKIIISSKLFFLYLINLLFSLVLLIPVYIVYISNISVTLPFHLLFWLTLFIIPLVPMIVATIVGSLLTILSSKFKFKNIANIVISLAFIVLVLISSMNMNGTSTIDMANLGKSMVNLFNRLYPLTKLYLNILVDYNVLSLLLFIVIPVALFGGYLMAINKYYDRINSNLSKKYTKGNYKIVESHHTSPLMALYKKELKRYFSSYNYVLNTAMGSVMLTLAIIFFVFSGSAKLDALGFPGLGDVFSKYGPIVLGSFCLLNCSTHSSISLEGKNLWIIKSLPTNPMNIFISKIMVNMTILVPTIFINATILSIYLKANLFTYIFMLVTPFLYATFISGLGILINLFFPVFNWDNEIRIIKQSMSSFLSLFIGMVFAVIPFVIKIKLSNSNYILLITGIVLILNIALYSLLKTIGEKKFFKL